jgi:tRNA (cmo5U34)-methyltransferase
VVSALSLHHVGPPNLKPIFENVRQALKPGGLFVNADQVLSVTPQHEAKLQHLWIEQIRALGCTETEIEAALGRMKADDPATLEFQLQALRDAGFEAVECWYKSGRFAVYSGVKN